MLLQIVRAEPELLDELAGPLALSSLDGGRQCGLGCREWPYLARLAAMGSNRDLTQCGQLVDNLAEHVLCQPKLGCTRVPFRTALRHAGQDLGLFRIVGNRLVEPGRGRQPVDQIEQPNPAPTGIPVREIHAINLQQVSADLAAVRAYQLAEAEPSPCSPYLPS